ncbi:MAG: hypothetical protein NXI21_05115 [Alphaproteobacteria bacterium]|nr:hypothetical protein [Alphaproteobacteria bacterium]
MVLHRQRQKPALEPLGPAGAEAIDSIGRIRHGAWTQAAPLSVFGIGLAAAAGSGLAAGRRGGAAPSERTARRIQRMGGAWIASLTAFAVVNLPVLPDRVVWLGPSVLVSPPIGVWVRRHAPRTPRGPPDGGA